MSNLKMSIKQARKLAASVVPRSRIVSGRWRPPRGTLERLAAGLGVDVDELGGWFDV
jgi:hypothetical protein